MNNLNKQNHKFLSNIFVVDAFDRPFSFWMVLLFDHVLFSWFESVSPPQRSFGLVSLSNPWVITNRGICGPN